MEIKLKKYPRNVCFSIKDGKELYFVTIEKTPINYLQVVEKVIDGRRAKIKEVYLKDIPKVDDNYIEKVILAIKEKSKAEAKKGKKNG